MPEERSPQGGYVTDVAYPRTFVPQIAPPVLRLVAALNGVAAPPEEDFDYCELGSAHADSLLTFAAASPKARFVGVDFNPEHTKHARARAEQGGLQNVRLLDHDFEALLEVDLPPMDFIVAHGIWSWVSPRKRAAILAFVAQRLKPGGLFYVSYNALPGWASAMPLRRLMQELVPVETAGQSTVERARLGLALAKRLADSGAAYFANHPTAKSMLALMQKGGLAYIAHEYFHADWEPMYFADVAGAMRAQGLGFLGQVPLYANVKELAIPPSLKTVAEAVGDRILLEGLKDFANDELFRSDVYVNAKVVRDPSETRYYFEGTPFGTLLPAAQLKREVKLPAYTLEYKGDVYEAILAAIAEGPATAIELGLLPALREAGTLRVGDCLRNLVLGGQVVAMHPAAEASAHEENEGGPFRIVHPWNVIALEDGLREAGPLVLASPCTGNGVHLSLLEALALKLVTDSTLTEADYEARVRTYAATRTMPLAFGDRRIKDADELVKIMAREVGRFRGTSLPKLVALGVVGVG